jgi:exodeoxyribonuclease VII small subunit
MSKKTESFEFESALRRLQEIVDALDSQNTSLKDSVHLYEEGIGLLEQSAKELAAYQSRITELHKRSDGVFELIDVSGNDANQSR